MLLTQGDRPDGLRRAIRSVSDTSVVVVANGCAAPELDESATVATLPANLGVPGGRHIGVDESSSDIVGFLDDDAEFRGSTAQIVEAFDEPTVGAVSLRLIDEGGETVRRHVPRAGGGGADESGDVALFLGGACAIRREAYEQVGGYFTELFYGHEEVELAWRLIDAGWTIRYLADVEVFHPKTEISRHADGWRLTGRNRVWIARRTLPWAIALPHVSIWLVLGAFRAPKGDCRQSYLRGWWSGWSDPIDRRPISWRGVWRLTKLRRPPII